MKLFLFSLVPLGTIVMGSVLPKDARIIYTPIVFLTGFFVCLFSYCFYLALRDLSTRKKASKLLEEKELQN